MMGYWQTLKALTKAPEVIKLAISENKRRKEQRAIEKEYAEKRMAEIKRKGL